ncbi:hypothetical protein TRAPUB_4102 [Trametes pubescens]|uniref:Xylanolytic transcriptional activator regulatory domain-containing protein n=1 Tax=Trametes pubescens TaxID=154538 RepID=A0A1M2VBX5_TRAPU|nr:hypothetical protein TRAPUB_4102 [Trametes pubescens]
MEELVDKLQPRTHTSPREHTATLGGISALSSPDSTAQSSPAAAVAPPVFNAPSPADSDDLDPSDDEMESWNKLLHSFRKFSLRPVTQRYHGKSSSMMLLQTAVDMKYEYTGAGPESWVPEPSSNPCAVAPNGQWSLPTAVDDVPPHTDFPPMDLMKVLADAYFEQLNLYIPLLHRPTFDRQLKEGLHLEDEGFGSVVLLVCANGGRMSDDPRVAEYGPPGLPGWNWFLQVEKARKSIFNPPQLTDLQKCVLMSSYLGSYSSPHNCWTLIGIGIRTAQDLGAHRRKTYASMPKAQGELYRRAFWCLLMLDRMLSFSLGRPCALQDEDFDADPLIECDDEYWDTGDPERDFKQPAERPSKLAFMNGISRLMQIMAFALRTLYSINKSKMLLGFVGHEWEERIVAELDSLLNKWIDTLPDHLRWDPHREDLVFLNQSSVLYMKYYQLQIFIHRPFLPTSRKSSRLTLPSLAICTNAARSCIHVSDVQCRRNGTPLAYSRMPLFTAGIVLLINMWGGKRAGLANCSAATDVQKCMVMLKMLEAQSRAAGRLWDVLNSLYAAGEFKSPPDPTPNRKRPRDSDQPEQEASASTQRGPTPSEKSVDSQPTASKRASYTSIHRRNTSQDVTPTNAPTTDSDSPWGGSQIGWSGLSSDSSSPASFNELPVRTVDLERMPFGTGFSPFFDARLAQPQQAETPGASQSFSNGMAAPDFAQFASPVDFPFAVAQPPTTTTAPPVNGTSSTSGLAAFFHPFGSIQVVEPLPAVSQDAAAFQFAPLRQQQQQPTRVQPQGQISTLSTMGPPPDKVQPNNAQALPSFSEDDLALADNTLDMWSSAPTNLDWADWGVFVNSVSGGGAPLEWPTSEPPVF